MYATHTLFVNSPCTWQPFMLTQQSWMDPTAPKKKGLPTQSPTCRSASPPPSFSPNTTIKVVTKVNHMLTNKLHRFTGSISLACDQSIQYLLMGGNPSVLNQHMRELQPWRCRLATSHSPPFTTDGFPLSPGGPSWSQVIKLNNFPAKTRRSNPKSREWNPSFDFYHNLTSKHSIC
jgi:hypothetical protein